MSTIKLVIGNKNFSSWSMRPWLLLKNFNIAFDEVPVALYQRNTAEKLGPLSPSLKVPALLHQETTVWDSLAICEYISEALLEGRGWPASPRKRATARSVCAEIHSEFPNLKRDWPMNCKASVQMFASEEIANEMKDKVTVAKINIDENPMTPSKYGVRGIPTLMLFKDGQVAATKIGALPKGKLVEWVESVIWPFRLLEFSVTRPRREAGPFPSPAVPELAQFQEHGFRSRIVGQVGERFPEPLDHARAVQTEEGVDFLLQRQGRHHCLGRVLIRDRAQQRLRLGVVGFAIQGEFQIVGDVIVARIDQGRVRQLRQLSGEGPVQLLGMAAVVAIAGARVEQRVAAEQRRRVGARQQADVRQGVAGRVQAFQIHGLADFDDVAGAQAPIHAGDAILGVPVRQYLGAGGRHHRLVAADVIAVLVGVEDLRDRPAFFLRAGQAARVIEGVDRHGLAGFRAGDQIVEIAVRVGGPDLLDDHGGLPVRWAACRP